MEQLEYLVSQFNWGAAAQIILVALLFHAILALIRGTQADILVRGALVVLVAILVIGRVLQLPLINWIVENGLILLGFAMVVVFQPEIRRLLERVGRTGTLVARPFGNTTSRRHRGDDRRGGHGGSGPFGSRLGIDPCDSANRRT